MRVAKILTKVATAVAGLTVAGGAYAQEAAETLGKPIQDGINFQTPATEVMRDIIWVDNFLLYIITAISIFVTIFFYFKT